MATRRTRLIWATAGVGIAFAIAIAAFLWVRSANRPTYRPGGEVEGLTASLARNLPPDYPRVVFTDVTDSAGIRFRHFQGTRSSWIPEDMGSGAAWGDYDGDGWVDLFVVNEAGPLGLPDSARRHSPARSTLYRNNGDGTFTDVTDAAGVDHRALGMGAAWADYDNDGRLDLVVTAFGVNTLYHNNGDGRFTDRSRASGVGGPVGFWTGASWGDYDRDGYLDLYITGYVRFVRRPGDDVRLHNDPEDPASLNPSSYAPERNLLYHNNRNGTFTEVAARAGVIDTTGRGLSASWTDFDEDGWPDLYVANDVSDNALFRNRGNGRFEDISHPAGVADYRSAMGLAVGDWDGDGDQDIAITHWIAQENALYDNQRQADPGPLRFRDEADRFGLGQIALDFIGWGTSFLDYDNDGWLDLIVVNGSTFQDRNDPTRLVAMKNQLFWNRGPKEGFFDVSSVGGAWFQQPNVGRGAAIADYDRDGDLDVFVVVNGGRGVLLRNDGGDRNAWLDVDLRNTTGNTEGVGATIRVIAGGRSQVRQVGAQSSYLSQNARTEHFGLGQLTRVDTLEVTWPGGQRQRLLDLPVNQRLVVEPDRNVATEVPPADTLGGRARVLTFWERYRAATARRLAHDSGAAEAYRQALALNPSHEDGLYYLGQMELLRGNYGAAEQAWRTLARVNPTSSRPHSRLGALFACLAEGAPFRLDSAESRVRRAHQINPEETGPSLQLAEIALLRNDPAEAGRRLADVLGSHATSPVAHFYQGYLAWKAGDQQGAARNFRLASEGAAVRALPQAVAGEGDTRSGITAAPPLGERCDELRHVATVAAGPHPPAEMLTRFRRLDSLLTAGRKRIGARPS